MAFAYPLTALITIITLLLYFWISFNVGKARARYQVPAPRMDGSEDFQRVYRVQANTVEQLVLFLPLLWLAAGVVGDTYAAVIGGLWPVGRFLYAIGYYKDAGKRKWGFMLNILTYVILLGGVLYALAVHHGA